MKQKVFKFRLSSELYDLLILKSNNANLNISEFLRKTIESTTVKTNNKNEIKQLIWNVNKIGTNINQLSHALNYSIQMQKLDKYSYANLINQLSIIETQLNNILDKEL